MLNRRHLLCCGAAAATGLFTALSSPARASLRNACRTGLPPALQDVVAAAFDGLDPQQLWDVHTHLLGTGDSGSGCTVNAQLDQWWHPVEMLRKRFILNAACVPTDTPSVDRAYVQRLRALADDFPEGARCLLFAFDHACDEAGRPVAANTTFHVPDAYAAAVADQHRARFAWVASIHPYRPDALARLDAALAGGAVALKWLPSSMAIDLRDPRLRPFYDRLATTRLPVIVHCGEEKAVPGAGREDLGNPLHVRTALGRGVRVIVARTLLTRRDWHPRLLHGSDYPLPGIAATLRLPALVRAGLLHEADVAPLAALRDHNPLLFDLAVKRRVTWRGAAWTPTVFATRRHVERPAVS